MMIGIVILFLHRRSIVLVYIYICNMMIKVIVCMRSEKYFLLILCVTIYKYLVQNISGHLILDLRGGNVIHASSNGTLPTIH